MTDRLDSVRRAAARSAARRGSRGSLSGASSGGSRTPRSGATTPVLGGPPPYHERSVSGNSISSAYSRSSPAGGPRRSAWSDPGASGSVDAAAGLRGADTPPAVGVADGGAAVEGARPSTLSVAAQAAQAGAQRRQRLRQLVDGDLGDATRNRSRTIAAEPPPLPYGGAAGGAGLDMPHRLAAARGGDLHPFRGDAPAPRAVTPPPRGGTSLRRTRTMPEALDRRSSRIDVPGDKDDSNNPYRRALALLRGLKLACMAEGGETSIRDATVDYLTGFVETTAAAAAEPDAVSYFMKQRFSSLPDVTDDGVKNYIIANYTPRKHARRPSLSFSRLTFNAPTPRSMRALLLSPTIERELGNIDRWDFNIFRVFEEDPGNVLRNVVFQVFQEHALLVRFGIDELVLRNYLTAVERGYFANPYHNAIHGADVTQTMHYFLATGRMGEWLSDQLTLSAVLAACIHDLGHLGVNNAFLVNTMHPLALTYNDVSPLENMHVSTGFTLMRKDGHDILNRLEPDEKKLVRHTVIEMVLATDNASHAKVHGSLKTLLGKYRDAEGNLEDPAATITDSAELQVVLNNALHAADVSNVRQRRARPSQPCCLPRRCPHSYAVAAGQVLGVVRGVDRPHHAGVLRAGRS